MIYIVSGQYFGGRYGVWIVYGWCMWYLDRMLIVFMVSGQYLNSIYGFWNICVQYIVSGQYGDGIYNVCTVCEWCLWYL